MEKRPADLTSMAYQWCSTITEAAPNQRGWHRHITWDSEEEFSRVGPGYDPVRLDDTSPHAGEPSQGLAPEERGVYLDILLAALKVGFRLFGSNHHQPPLHLYLNHTSHHERMFEAAFSSDDDEAIADAMCAWIAGVDRPDLSCTSYFAERVERPAPFSPRLRRVGISAIEHVWCFDPTVSGLEIVRWLHRLDADVDDVRSPSNWASLLAWAIRSPTGFETLSSHYWCLLGKLMSTTRCHGHFEPRDLEVMRLLEEAEDWEKLEVWMAAIWQSLSPARIQTPELMEGIEQVTLGLSLRRLSALQRFENLRERNATLKRYKIVLQRICNQARAEQSP